MVRYLGLLLLTSMAAPALASSPAPAASAAGESSRPAARQRLLDQEPRSATAIAIEDTELLSLHRNDFQAALSDNRSITTGLIRVLSSDDAMRVRC